MYADGDGQAVEGITLDLEVKAQHYKNSVNSPPPQQQGR